MATNIAIAKESELRTRARIISNVFKERHNCIVLRVDTHVNDEKGVNPFGFHFEFDKEKYKERKKQMKRESVTKWLALLAFVHHKLGIRHLLLVLAMAVYVVAGGLLFRGIEAGPEKEALNAALSKMDETMDEFVNEIVNVTLTVPNEEKRDAMLLHLSREFYKDMLQIEGRYQGSAWHKAQDLDIYLVWSFGSSVFYSCTLFTTIGYGSIACQTWLGRWMSVLYASLGIPLMLLLLGDIGELIQRTLAKALLWIKAKIRNRFCADDKKDVESMSAYSDLTEEGDDEQEPEYILPIWLATSMIILFIAIVSACIHLFDKDELGNYETDMESAVYFVFISLTTIGLGDVMPKSLQYNPLLILSFLFGLSLVSIINSSVYAQLYETFYTGVTAVEGTLESIHNTTVARDGHKLFKQLEPVFSTLALSFPQFVPPPKNGIRAKNFLSVPFAPRKRAIGSVLVTERSLSAVLPPTREVESGSVMGDGKPKRKIARVWSALEGRRRTPTLLPGTVEFKEKIERQRGRARAPTLGALGGMDLQRIRRIAAEAKKNSGRAASNSIEQQDTLSVPRRRARTRSSARNKRNDKKNTFSNEW